MAKSIMGACKSGRCEGSAKVSIHRIKLHFLPFPLLFLVFLTRLHIVHARPLKVKQSKDEPTDLNWCVGLVSLLSCALTPLLPRRAKRDRLHAALRTNESGEEEENQSIEPRDPRKKSVYEYRYHAVCGAAGSGITQSQGSMSKPILRSACDNVQERSARGSDRPCVLVLVKYINECGCVAFDVRSGESCVCVCLSLLFQGDRPAGEL